MKVNSVEVYTVQLKRCGKESIAARANIVQPDLLLSIMFPLRYKMLAPENAVMSFVDQKITYTKTWRGNSFLEI